MFDLKPRKLLFNRIHNINGIKNHLFTFNIWLCASFIIVSFTAAILNSNVLLPFVVTLTCHRGLFVVVLARCVACLYHCSVHHWWALNEGSIGWPRTSWPGPAVWPTLLVLGASWPGPAVWPALLILVDWGECFSWPIRGACMAWLTTWSRKVTWLSFRKTFFCYIRHVTLKFRVGEMTCHVNRCTLLPCKVIQSKGCLVIRWFNLTTFGESNETMTMQDLYPAGLPWTQYNLTYPDLKFTQSTKKNKKMEKENCVPLGTLNKTFDILNDTNYLLPFYIRFKSWFSFAEWS